MKVAFVVTASGAVLTPSLNDEGRLMAMGANFAVRFVVIVVRRFRAVEELNNAASVSLHVNKSALAQVITSRKGSERP